MTLHSSPDGTALLETQLNSYLTCFWRFSQIHEYKNQWKWVVKVHCVGEMIFRMPKFIKICTLDSQICMYWQCVTFSFYENLCKQNIFVSER